MSTQQPAFTFVDTRFGLNRTVRTEFGHYHNGRVALQLKVHGNQDDCFDGEPYSTATVNLPEVDLPPGKTTIKSWSENEGVPEMLVKAGILEPHVAGDPPEMYGFTAAAKSIISQMAPFAGAPVKPHGIRPQ